MKWQIKYIRNAMFGIIPLFMQEKLRNMKRSLIPYDIEIDLVTLRQGLRQIETLKLLGCEPSGKDYLEVGTGWSPIIPLLFSLSGCRSLALIDSQCLMDNYTFAETCRKLLVHKEEISKNLRIPLAYIEKRLNKLAIMSLESALLEMNCKYMAPCDFLNSDIEEYSLDIITSRAVLEHVPPQIVNKMVLEFNRILRKDGYMCHIIDNSDHWEHNDKSISRLNFLRYNECIFNMISSMNPLDYQNRLRDSEYKNIIKEVGFKIGSLQH